MIVLKCQASVPQPQALCGLATWFLSEGVKQSAWLLCSQEWNLKEMAYALCSGVGCYLMGRPAKILPVFNLLGLVEVLIYFCKYFIKYNNLIFLFSLMGLNI